MRTALVMSALTQQSVKIENVRGATNYPGIDIEDLALIKALTASTTAQVKGGELGSKELTFKPTRPISALKGNSLDFKGAESQSRVPNANVVLNSLLPVLARSGAYSEVSLSGETYGAHSICFDYFSNVTLAAQRALGLYAFPEQVRAGFGREGGGELSVEVEPSALNGVLWSRRGDLVAARAVIAIGELPMTVAHRGLAHLTNLGNNSKLPLEVEIIPVDARKPGLCITCWTEFENGIGGATAVGAKGIRVEAVAQSAFEDMLDWVRSECTVDSYLADQLLPTMVAAEGESVFTVSRITKRFLTIVWVIKQFLPIHITIKGAEGEAGEIAVRR